MSEVGTRVRQVTLFRVSLIRLVHPMEYAPIKLLWGPLLILHSILLLLVETVLVVRLRGLAMNLLK